MSNIQIFKNEKLNFEVKMKLDNGEEVFDVETVARSLGLISVSAKSGRKYENVRWTRVNEYLKLANTEYEVKKGDFISEPMVYKLAFKANNEVAENFQDWLAVEVIPQIRKTGSYQSEQKVIEGLNNIIEDMQQTITENKETIEEYKSMCKINCSKKRNYTDYIKKRLGITKANSEFEQVKARVFLILNINKWEDVELETSKNILNVIDESITIVKRERPYKQMSYFDEAIG